MRSRSIFALGGLIVVLAALSLFISTRHESAAAQDAPPRPADRAAPATENSVSLTDRQLKTVAIAPVAERAFNETLQAVGNIDFNQDMTAQVSPPYAGRIVELFAKAGDHVRQGQVLFTMESADLVQAESTLIASAGVADLANRVLRRAQELYAEQGLTQKDYEQAVSDQQAAEAASKAARDAVKIFGKTDADIEHIITGRHIDPRMVVRSPLSGQVTARNAAPGALVQPGANPAPYTVADLATKWMLANIQEADLPLIRLGQEVAVTLMAYPGREFRGKVSYIGAAIDPNTHRIVMRSEIKDAADQLRPQMLANFTVRTGEARRSLAIPDGALVREGDGSMVVWVTTDRRRFTARIVKLGLQQAGYFQILDGLKAGELIASDGALFISNAHTLEAK